MPETPTIYLIEDDPIMAECIARAVTAPLAQSDPQETDHWSFSTENPDPAPTKQSPKTDQQSFYGTSPLIAHPTNNDHRSFSCQIFPDAISAMTEIEQKLPDLILLDILLGGPDGFTLLNELGSYADTAKIPIIIATSLNLSLRDLSYYNVTAVLNKATMTPALIQKAVRDAL